MNYILRLRIVLQLRSRYMCEIVHCQSHQIISSSKTKTSLITFHKYRLVHQQPILQKTVSINYIFVNYPKRWLLLCTPCSLNSFYSMSLSFSGIELNSGSELDYFISSTFLSRSLFYILDLIIKLKIISIFQKLY